MGDPKLGTVLIFKPGVTEEEAAAALESLENLLDNSPSVNVFNANHGSPVWYIP